MFINLKNIDFYSKALDGTWERNKAISSNIANVNTPNYKRKYVSFEDQLKTQLNKNIRLKETHENHITTSSDNFSPIKHTDNSDSYRFDNNNVNIDVESKELAKNTIMYDAISRQVSAEFEKIKNVITEGSK